MTAKTSSFPKPRRRPALRILFRAIVAILLLVIAWNVWFQVRTSKEIGRLEARVRANGEPWTLAELAASEYLSIPDGENAAIALMDLWAEEDPDYWKAIRRNEVPPKPRRYEPLPDDLPAIGQLIGDDPLSTEEAAAWEGYLDGKQERIERLHAALARGRARFPIGLLRGHSQFMAESTISRSSMLKREAGLLGLQSFRLLADGELDGAIEAAVDVVRVGETLREEPLIIGQLVRFAIQKQAFEAIGCIVNRRQLSDAQLNRLMGALQPLAGSDAVRRALICERAMVIDIFQDPEKAREFLGNGTLRDESRFFKRVGRLNGLEHVLDWTGVLRADEAYYLTVVEGCIANASLPLPECMAANKRTFQNLVAETDTFPRRMLSRSMLSGLEKVFHRQAQWEAQVSATRLVLAVERYRLTHGDRFPESIEALVPDFIEAVPTDPFDGKPMRCLVRGREYAVYSVGEDRVDDGGRAKPDTNKTGVPWRGNFDEVVSVSR